MHARALLKEDDVLPPGARAGLWFPWADCKPVLAVLDSRVAVVHGSAREPCVSAFDFDGDRFVTVARYQFERPWVNAHCFVNNCLAFLTPSVLLLATGSYGSYARVESIDPFVGSLAVAIWPPAPNMEPRCVAAHGAVTLAVSWMQKDGRAVSHWCIRWYSRQAPVMEWVPTRAVVRVESTVGSFSSLCFSRDGGRLIACDNVGDRLCAFRTEDGALVNSVGSLKAPESVVECDGAWLVGRFGSASVSLVAQEADVILGTWQPKWQRTSVLVEARLAASAALGILSLKPCSDLGRPISFSYRVHVYSTPNMLAMEGMSPVRVMWIAAAVVV